MRRHVPQFTLRTLLAITAVVALGWGWELRIVRTRQAALREIESRGGSVWAGPESEIWLELTVGGSNPMRRPREAAVDRVKRESQVPRLRQWLGDEQVFAIHLPEDEFQASLAGLQAIFPGTEIVRLRPVSAEAKRP